MSVAALGVASGGAEIVAVALVVPGSADACDDAAGAGALEGTTGSEFSGATLAFGTARGDAEGAVLGEADA